jgi:hypothetical protein
MCRDLRILTTKMLEWESMSFTNAIVLQVISYMSRHHIQPVVDILNITRN